MESPSIPTPRYSEGHETPSGESYATGGIPSSMLGFLGIQPFNLGRIAEGVVDLGLSIGWMTCLAMGEPLWAILLGVVDFGHSFVVTIQLFTGNFRDGEGRRVPYPGQKLK